MASLTVSAVLLLVCVVGLLVVCTPRRKLETKNQILSHHTSKLSLSADKRDLGGNNQDRVDGSVSSSSDRKSPRSLDSQEVILDRVTSPRSTCADQTQQVGAVVSTTTPSNGDLNNTVYNELRPMERSGSAFEPHNTGASFDGHNSLPQCGHKMRSSLRNSSSSQVHRSGRFAAISESLEHKLQRGPQQVFMPRAPSNELRQDEQEAPEQKQQQQQTTTNHQQQQQVAFSELERNSLINKLWSRLLMKPERAPSVATGRRLKTRPIISMPVSVNQSSSSGARRSSVNLSRLTGGANSGAGGINETNSANGKINSLNSNHINSGHHLVSSKANLIQDSTTASDGTASSGRSSSSSAGQQHHEVAAAGVAMMAPSLGSYPSAADYLQQQQQQHQAMWMQQPPVDVLQMNRSPKLMMGEHGGAPLDCGGGLYVNHDTGAYNHHQVADQQGHLYTNTVAYLAPTGNPYSAAAQQKPPLDHSAQMINGYTVQPLGWSDHNQSAIPIGVGHYQLSMLNNNNHNKCSSNNNNHDNTAESQIDFSDAQQQAASRAYYATINNNNNNNKQVADQQRQNFNHQTTTASGNYGTLPVRIPPDQIITTDVADAIFDANYGTLISRSSVYRTLGYAAPNNQHNNTTTTCNSSSSSPNSLTTHTNNTLNGSIQDNANHLPTFKFSSQALLNGDIQFGDNQVAIVHSDGSTITTTNTSLATAKSNLNDKGLATNV